MKHKLRRGAVVSRYGEIIGVLSKYGLAEFVSHRPFLRRLSIPLTRSGGKYRPPRLVREHFAQRLRRALEELGPTFIKFGQILADRADIVPDDVILELRKLQNEVAPFPAADARARVEKSFGQPIDRLFVHFSDSPEGSASLAQVHRAILPTGQPVAVKIKRPGIDEQILADLEIMKQLAGFLDTYTHYFKVVTATEIIQEFEVQILKELDFVEEFLSITKFAADYVNDSTVAVAHVFKDYVSRDVLVQEFMHGRKVSEVIASNDSQYDRKEINRRTADFMMSQLFINGYFHADPHPGNFLVLPGNVICFIDFGMVYSLRPYEQENLNLMMIGLSRLDPSLVARSLLRMGYAEGRVDPDRFEAAVHDYIESHLARPLEYIDIPAALMHLLQMVVNYGVRLPPRFIYVAKVLSGLQTIGAALDPDFQLIKYLRNFAPQMWVNQVASERAGNKVLNSALNWQEALLNAPMLVQDVHRVLRDRRFVIEVPETAHLAETIDRIGFRMTFGLVLSALLVSSALVVLADIQPQIAGIPLFGIVGFTIGGVMGLIFLFAGMISFFRWHKHHR